MAGPSKAVDRATFREAMEPLMTAMCEITDAVTTVSARHGEIAWAESLAMREISDQSRYAERSGWAEAFFDTHTLGAFTLRATADYLRSYAEAFRAERPPMYGHLVLARAALESSVICWWLSEPGIARDDRLKRGLSEYIYSAGEQRRIKLPDGSAQAVSDYVGFATALGWRVRTAGGKNWKPGKGDKPYLDDSIEADEQELTKEQREASYSCGSCGQNRLTWKRMEKHRDEHREQTAVTIGPLCAQCTRVGRPSTPAGIGHLVAGDPKSRLGTIQWSRLSSVVHVSLFGLRWAFMEDHSAPSHISGHVNMPIGTDAGAVVLQAICVLKAMRMAAEARFELMGWRDDEWRSAAAGAEGLERNMLAAIRTRFPDSSLPELDDDDTASAGAPTPGP